MLLIPIKKGSDIKYKMEDVLIAKKYIFSEFYYRNKNVDLNQI